MSLRLVELHSGKPADIGVVEAIGEDVVTINVGDFVIAPFYVCDNSCVNCRNGVSTSCVNGSWWGGDDRDGGFADGAQGERVRLSTAGAAAPRLVTRAAGAPPAP